MVINRKIARRIVALALLCLWGIALFLPVFAEKNYLGPLDAKGFEILALAWLGPLLGQFAWYGNIALLFSIIVCLIGKKPHPFLNFALIALAFDAFTAFGYFEVSGGWFEITGRRSGFFLWEAICLIMAGYGLLEDILIGQRETTDSLPAESRVSDKN